MNWLGPAIVAAMLALVGACALALASPAAAQEGPPTSVRAWPAQCGDRAAIETWLAEQFGERARMAGVTAMPAGVGVLPEAAQNKPVYLWAGRDGSWSVLVVSGDDACILAAGRAGVPIEGEPKGRGM